MSFYDFSMNVTANSEVHVNETSSEHRAHTFQVLGEGQVEVTFKARGNIELTQISSLPVGRRPQRDTVYKGSEVNESLAQLSSPIATLTKRDRIKKYESQFV